MATVYERFNHLGLASSNKLLTQVGVTVYNNFYNTHTQASDKIKIKMQEEHDGRQYPVNDYPDEWDSEMDKIILSFINGQTN